MAYSESGRTAAKYSGSPHAGGSFRWSRLSPSRLSASCVCWDETGASAITTRCASARCLAHELDQHGKPYELTRFVMRSDLTGLLYDAPIE
jgi:hypothetical protein